MHFKAWASITSTTVIWGGHCCLDLYAKIKGQDQVVKCNYGKLS